MKKAKTIAALLAVCLVFGMAGCSTNDGDIKDNLIDGFNGLLQHFSKYALTDKKDLQGKKTEGEDTYTGSYTAEYDDFSGTEYLFGGTGLERENGNELTVTYELTVESGSAELYWREGEEKHLIADTSQSDTYSITLSSQDNYIVIFGENFQGTVDISVT